MVTVFPELGISSYTADDLFHQDALGVAVQSALQRLIAESIDIATLMVVGVPLRAHGRLFNCAVAISGGRVLGVVPKSYLPNYQEFYEKRQFAAARDAVGDHLDIDGQHVPFGDDLLFEATNLDGCVLHVEICQDSWIPAPPSVFAALSGATVLADLSASSIVAGKADYRRELCVATSARNAAAYLYTSAGDGESTTDMAWDGQAMICENGSLLAEGTRFSNEPQLVSADIDLQRLAADRLRMTSFTDNATDHRERVTRFRRIRTALPLPDAATVPRRDIPRFPYVPADPHSRVSRTDPRAGRRADTELRRRDRPVRPAGLPPLPAIALRRPPEPSRLSRPSGMGRSHARTMARHHSRAAPPRIRPADDQILARSVPAPVHPDQPVQAFDTAQRPTVGSGGSLSLRGDRRAPSDASARAWLDELDRNVPGPLP